MQGWQASCCWPRPPWRNGGEAASPFRRVSSSASWGRRWATASPPPLGPQRLSRRRSQQCCMSLRYFRAAPKQQRRLDQRNSTTPTSRSSSPGSSCTGSFSGFRTQGEPSGMTRQGCQWPPSNRCPPSESSRTFDTLLSSSGSAELTPPVPAPDALASGWRARNSPAHHAYVVSLPPCMGTGRLQRGPVSLGEHGRVKCTGISNTTTTDIRSSHSFRHSIHSRPLRRGRSPDCSIRWDHRLHPAPLCRCNPT